MESLTLIRTTQALGITTSLVMAGINFGTSAIGIHPLYPLPTNEIARIFSDLYHNGAGVLVPLALGSAAICAASAYLVPEARTEYAVASASNISTMAFTGLVMMPGIQKLVLVAEMGERSKIPRDEVIRLLMAWRTHNFVRAGLGFIGGVLSVYAVVKRL